MSFKFSFFLLEFFFFDDSSCKLSESGGDAVHHLVLRDDVLNHLPGLRHPLLRFLGQLFSKVGVKDIQVWTYEDSQTRQEVKAIN